MTDFVQVKADYQKFSENLLEVPFTTLDDYFEALKDYGQRMDKLVNKVRIIILGNILKLKNFSPLSIDFQLLPCLILRARLKPKKLTLVEK